MPTIEDRLRDWQQQLLDFSNRNSLLNFRPSTSRPSTVELIAPNPTEIFNVLLSGKGLTIHGNDPVQVEEAVDAAVGERYVDAEDLRDDEHVERPVDELDQDAFTPVVQRGTALASLTSEKADRVLLRLAARARGAELEQGVNTLFAAFGLLKWQDPRDAKRWQFSPLILLPIRIEDVPRERRYRIVGADDEPELNQTLTEFMRRQLGLELPLEVHEDSHLDELLAQVREEIAGRTGWEVLDQVHLGHFQFYKLRMFEDLSAHASVAANHEIIQALGSEVMSITSSGGSSPAEEELDRLVPPDQTFSVLDADASQLQAIQSALRGSHLIIQGPPGTGKSQTIANIIAECIANGRTVLFVSEKAAAIDVVYRRLAQQGLGDYCLPLHSHKANKRDIILELGEQLEVGTYAPITAKDRVTLSRLQEERLALDDYAESLHRPRGVLQESIFWAQGELIQLQDVPLLAVDSFSPMSLTHESLEKASRLLQDLANHADVLGQGDHHPWSGVYARTLSLTERDRLQHLLVDVPSQIHQLLEASAALAELIGLGSPATVLDIETLCDVAGRVPDDGGLRPGWFQPHGLDEAVQLLNSCKANAVTLRDLESQLLETYDPGFFAIANDEAIGAYEQGMLGRLFSSSYRAVRSRIRALTRSGHNRSHDEEAQGAP